MLSQDNWTITQYYGLTPYAKANPQLYKSFGGIHPGIDIVGDREIPAFFEGVVSKVIYGDSGWGNHIEIKGSRFTYLYAHLRDIYVKEGDYITKGQKIAYMGSTGVSTGVHLHFGMYYRIFWRKKWIDPLPYLLNNNTNNMIERIVKHNQQNLRDINGGIKAFGFDKGREKPFVVQNGSKRYYNTIDELFASQFLLWMSSEDANQIPNKE